MSQQRKIYRASKGHESDRKSYRRAKALVCRQVFRERWLGTPEDLPRGQSYPYERFNAEPPVEVSSYSPGTLAALAPVMVAAVLGSRR